MGNKFNATGSKKVRNKQEGNGNESEVKDSEDIVNEQMSSNSNDNIILIIAIGIIIASFYFISQEKSISKEFLQILYIFVSASIAIIGNFLIGTINITYKDDKGILKTSGSIALGIIAFIGLQYGLKQ